MERLAAADTEAEQRRIGVAATVDLANAALDAGAPGIHLYTFNEHAHALDVLDKLALPRPARPTFRAQPVSPTPEPVRHEEFAI